LGTDPYNQILVHLERRRDLDLILIDESGAPLRGIQTVSEESCELLGVSDAQGHVQMSIDHYHTNAIHFVGDNVVTERQSTSSLAPGAKVVLRGGRRVGGVVKFSDGMPATNVEVRQAAEPLGCRPSICLTNAEGRFILSNVPMNATELEFLGRGVVTNHIAIDATATALNTIILQRSGQLRGRVLDQGTHQPVSPFTLKITPERGDTSKQACSIPGDLADGARIFFSRDGTFEVADVDGNYESTVQMEIRAAGYAPRVFDHIRLHGDESKGKLEVFELAPGRIVHITVIDRDDRPIDGATARLEVGSTPPNGHSRRDAVLGLFGPTSSSGQLELNGCPQSPLHMMVTRTGYTPQIIDIAPECNDFTVRMSKRGRLVVESNLFDSASTSHFIAIEPLGIAGQHNWLRREALLKHDPVVLEDIAAGTYHVALLDTSSGVELVIASASTSVSADDTNVVTIDDKAADMVPVSINLSGSNIPNKMRLAFIRHSSGATSGPIVVEYLCEDSSLMSVRLPLGQYAVRMSTATSGGALSALPALVNISPGVNPVFRLEVLGSRP
jgi:hypothetical protein